MIRACPARWLLAVTMFVPVTGCHSCAGIADLEVGAGGGAGATGTTASTPASSSSGDGGATGASTTTGDAATSSGTESTGSTTSSVSASSSGSTSSGGVPCDGDTCEVGEFCEGHTPPGGFEENCRVCGEVPVPPPVKACPPFCTNDCAGDVCLVDCAVEVEHCQNPPTEIFLDPKPLHMTIDCPGGGLVCTSKRISCLGPSDMEGPGRHDCHLVCDGAGACNGTHLDCSEHPGRCIVECRNGGCFGAEITCGDNECITCGGGSEDIAPTPADACRVTQAAVCATVL